MGKALLGGSLLCAYVTYRTGHRGHRRPGGGQFEEARFPQLSGLKKECRQAPEGTETPPCFHVWCEIKADRSTGSDKGF